MADILYETDGKGNWWRTTWKPQCDTKLLWSRRCQGVVGHDGLHWCFEGNGDFVWKDNEKDPQCAGCSGVTPPDHKDYRSPSAMRILYHLSSGSSEVVTDPDLIKALEDDNPPEGHDNVSIIAPLGEDDPWFEECQRRLAEHKANLPE